MDKISAFRKEPIHRISYEIEDENGIPDLKVKFGGSGYTQGRKGQENNDFRTDEWWDFVQL